MTSAPVRDRSPIISSPRRTRRSCSSTTSPHSWPGSTRWIVTSWSRTPSRPLTV